MALRVAIDANVLIAGIAWPRWPYEVLRHAEQGDFTLVLSPLVMAEARNRIEKDFPHLLERFVLFLELLDYEAAPVPTPEEVAVNTGLVRQAKDIPIALSIQSAQVDYFVTYDRDFTDQDETTEKVRQAIRHRQWSDLD